MAPVTQQQVHHVVHLQYNRQYSSTTKSARTAPPMLCVLGIAEPQSRLTLATASVGLVWPHACLAQPS